MTKTEELLQWLKASGPMRDAQIARQFPTIWGGKTRRRLTEAGAIGFVNVKNTQWKRGESFVVRAYKYVHDYSPKIGRPRGRQ